MDVFGLPLHPLIVHAAVMLVPLAALGALVVVAWPAARRRYGWLTVGFAVAAAASAFVARASGDQLLQSLGGASASILTHHQWGLLAPLPAGVLALVLPVFLWTGRRPQGRLLSRLAALLTVAAALVGLVLIVLTGHSGAVAVWGR